MAPEGRLGGISEWAGKLSGLVVRLAGLLQACDDPAADLVGHDAAVNAVRLCRYATEHALGAFAEMAADEGHAPAKLVLDAIRRKPDREICRRDISQRLKRRLKTAAVDAALAMLVEHGFIAPRAGQAGVFDLNPAAAENAENALRTHRSQPLAQQTRGLQLVGNAENAS